MWLCIVFALLTLAFFYPHITTDFVLARGDTFAYFYPYWQVRSEALMAGRLPLWAPELFMGVPLLANSQLGTFYPPNWLVAPLPLLDAMRLSMLLHVGWALAGAYLLARRAARLDRLPALTAAAVFAFGGYMLGRVEQINQLQGLSWLPWLLLILHHADTRPRRATLLLALALGLQFFTGHTQTVFISGVGMGIYTLCLPGRWRRLRTLVIASLLALVLALPQLIPTIELTSVSNRSGGLNPNEATAFSFNPFLAGRGLLPGYDLPIFTEYIAYPGILALALAVAGVIGKSSKHQDSKVTGSERRVLIQDNRGFSPAFPWIVLTLVSIVFALGQYTPIYWWLASLPGFNLFRVPARWLVLVALGIAILAGIGSQALPSFTLRLRWVVTGVWLAIIAACAGAALLLTTRNPEPVPAPPPGDATLLGWTVAVGMGIVVIYLLSRHSTPLNKHFSPFSWRLGVLLLVTAELWFAARALPYNQLVPSDVVTGQRFTVSQMLALNENDTPPGRLLSITNLLFDPGDRAALEARYRGLGMSEAEIRTAFVALKQQESLSVNLPLYWGIPTIDGFDGGVLPTRYYSAFASLMTPPDALRTIDGRLREILAQESCRGACMPDSRWLALTNTRYLLTDKIYDVWHDDAAYDTTLARTLIAGEVLRMRAAAPLVTTHIDTLVVGAAPQLTRVIDAEGRTTDVQLTGEVVTQIDDATLVRYTLETVTAIVGAQVEATGAVEVRALTLRDMRANVFQQTQPEGWQRILSSDIELYANLNVLPRAWVVGSAQFVADDIYGTEAALDIMRDSAFDPARSVVLAGSSDGEARQTTGIMPVSAAAEVISYNDERIVISVESDTPGYLLLSDAWYPGWHATINGRETPVLRANVMFRAVGIPAEQSEVVFEYRPVWLTWLPMMALSWLVVGGLTIFTTLQKPSFALRLLYDAEPVARSDNKE
ncbi:MAG: hypothetical protein SF123_15670 [Chloroflexota bacterium]|nr:hypothetical protein [Chloroflexota bacterium]